MQKEMNEITALFSKGRFQEALTRCDKLVEAHPKDDKIRYAQGMLRQKSGDNAGAVDSYVATAKIAPNHLAALTNLGGLLFTMQRTAEAIGPLQRAVKLDPKNFPARSNLAHSLFAEGNFDEALEEAGAARKLKADSFDIYLLLVQVNDKLDRFEDTVAAARKMIEIRPDRKDGWTTLAANLQALGRFDEAEEVLLKGLKRAPDDPDAHVLLAQGKRSPEDEQKSLRILKANVKSGRMPKREEIDARFAIADLLDRAGEYDEAFEAYRKANDLKQELEPYDRVAYEKFLEDVETVCQPGFFELRKGWGSESIQPVFVVGMPRSGTTLTEQILARHPDVEGFGERGLFEKVCDPKLDLRAYHEDHVGFMTGLTKEQVQAYAKEYLSAPSKQSPVPVHAVDKTPANILSLGMMSVVFPNARILFCRRDPIDVCLSNYQQNFALGQISSSSSLEALVHAYEMCERALAHFKRVLPIEIKEVEYEELVSNPDEAGNYLFDLAGLEYSGEEVDHTAGMKGVRTASSWQVRQPIYQTSVQKWRRYEKHLGVLTEGLAKFMPNTSCSKGAAE